MANFYQPGLVLPSLYTNQYSILRQERMYLLDALAQEEARGERLASALTALRQKLENFGNTAHAEKLEESEKLEEAKVTAESSEPQLTARKLKVAIKSVRNKIGRCQHRERALSSSLANVVTQMEGMKRYQWRNAQQQYSLQSHYGSMVVMSPDAPGFALQSPLTAGIAAQMQYMRMDSPRQSSFYYTMSPESQYQTPIWPQMSSGAMAWPANTTHPLPLHPQHHHAAAQNGLDSTFVSPISSISPYDLATMPTTCDEQSETSSNSVFSKGARPWSWPSVGSGYEADTSPVVEDQEKEEEPKPTDLTPRLSGIDATSVGTSLDKMSLQEGTNE
jgi:hypothetical protein